MLVAWAVVKTAQATALRAPIVLTAYDQGHAGGVGNEQPGSGGGRGMLSHVLTTTMAIALGAVAVGGSLLFALMAILCALAIVCGIIMGVFSFVLGMGALTHNDRCSRKMGSGPQQPSTTEGAIRPSTGVGGPAAGQPAMRSPGRPAARTGHGALE